MEVRTADSPVVCSSPVAHPSHIDGRGKLDQQLLRQVELPEVTPAVKHIQVVSQLVVFHSVGMVSCSW